MKYDSTIPSLDSAIQLSEDLEKYKALVKSLDGRVPYLHEGTKPDYEARFQQNTSAGTGRLGVDWLVKTERAIEVAEEFGLNLDLVSNRAFVSSMVLALT